MKRIKLFLSLSIFLYSYSPSSPAVMPATGNVNGANVKIPAKVVGRLAAGQPQDLIILFNATSIDNTAKSMRAQANLRFDDAAILGFKASSYRNLKQQVFAVLPKNDFNIIQDYSHLPMAFVQFRTPLSLNQLVARPEIKAVFENTKLYTQLTQSLPLIKQPAVASLGQTGNGTTVAILDTGVNYTLADFGSCTSPGVPSGCKVVVSQDIAPDDGALDDNGHGTNVAAISLGVAPDARVAMLDVFSGGSASSSWVISGINWAIANQALYNIVSINMSLGDGVDYTSPCSSSLTNPFLNALSQARLAGILPVAASGNDAYIDGISSPACTPGVVSVGAVYDANVGGLSYANCTDSTTKADQITCFSNSAGFLTLLAPGALITAGGYTMAGTSQATPHVAGATAVLRSAYPTETLDQITARMVNNGVSITDPRNSLVKPRLDLLASVGSINDTFTSSVALTGNSGQAGGTNVGATKETGEPDHAGNTGGTSIWWQWTAPVSGQVTLDTHGSDFDTLLAVYTGTAVGNLTAIAANDNDGSTNGNSGLLFQAQAGIQYYIVVDGRNGASGNVVLNWSINTAATADLSVAMTAAPDPVIAGNNQIYTITVTNNGPSTATNVSLVDTLPSSVTFTSSSIVCNVVTLMLNCSLGDLANAALSTITINVTPNTSGTITNNASISSDVPDPNSTNNAASKSTSVNPVPTMIDADVPMMPEWGMIVMVVSLLVSMVYLNREKRIR